MMQKRTTCEVCGKLRNCFATLILEYEMEAWVCAACFKKEKDYRKEHPNYKHSLKFERIKDHV